MPNTRLGVRFSQQPTGPSSVDWSHPITQGLDVAAYMGPTEWPMNYANGNTFTSTNRGLQGYSRSANGLSRSYDVTGGTHNCKTSIIPTTARGKITLVFIVRPMADITAGTANRTYVSAGESAGSWTYVSFGTSSEIGDNRFLCRILSTNYIYSDEPYVVGKTYVITYIVDCVTGVQTMYVNNVKQSGIGASKSGSTKKFDTLVFYPVATAPASLEFFAVFGWSRVLGEPELRRFLQNPYGIFKVNRQPTPYMVLAPVAPRRYIGFFNGYLREMFEANITADRRPLVLINGEIKMHQSGMVNNYLYLKDGVLTADIVGGAGGGTVISPLPDEPSTPTPAPLPQA